MSGLSDVSAVVPADLTGLSVGNYQVIVNDTQGCSGVASVTIQQPAVLEAITSAVSISCLNSVDGSANVAVTGGVAPYTYSWNNGGTDATITALATGNYTVNVTDSHGCITSAMAQVTAPIFDLSAIATNPTYVGGADGSIELTVSGDFGPFTYNWSNNAVTEDLNGLTAGTYVVTVMAGSCQYTESYTLTEGVTPDALAVSSAIVSDVNCLNGNDGLIDLTVEGGVMPYSYSWSNGALVQDLTGLTAGSYTVTITDAAPIMNSLVVTYTIDQPTTSVSMTYVTDNPTSCLLDGSISILVEGGTAPYTYEWSNGSTNEDLTQVGSGSYSVLIADANGCTYNSASINLVAYTMDLSVSVTPNVCNGGNDASVSVIVNNQLPQSFVWSNGGTTDYIENLTAGNYVVTVTDYYGCSVVENVAVVDPAPIVVSIATGSIGFTATVISGATGPVSYMWSNGKPYQSIKNLVSGTTYCVTVTDINGCTGTACAVWGSASMPMALNLTKEEMVAALTEVDFNLYPNPNMDGQFNLAVPAVEIDEMRVEVSDNTGRVIYSQSYSSVNDMNVFISLNRADAGVYYVRLILNNQKAITKRMVIIR